MPEVMTRFRDADPASHRALPEDARAALLDRIAAEPVPARGRKRIRLGSRRTLVLATLLALAISGVGLATFDFGQTPGQVRNDYARVIREVPLPPGYRWPGAMVDEDAVYAGRRAAIMTATAQASCAWWEYWLSAAKRGDARATTRALDGQARVFELTPRHRRGASEDVGGIDATTVAYHRLLMRDATAGRAARIYSYVRINC